MTQDIVLQALQGQNLITPTDVAILTQSKFKGFEPHEVAYAVKIAGALKLNPLVNQIHFIKRKNRDGSYSITPQTGIDGFRLTAQRAGGYAGSDEPIFEYEGANKKRPAKATVTVYRLVDGHRCAFTGSARWDEYYPGSNQMWDKMPHNQLAKCAEALALRKAFPAELSNVYTEDEMAQASAPTKAQDIEAKVKDEPIEVDSEVVSEPTPQSGECRLCGAAPEKIIISKRDPNSYYCFGCKKSYPIRGAA